MRLYLGVFDVLRCTWENPEGGAHHKALPPETQRGCSSRDWRNVLTTGGPG